MSLERKEIKTSSIASREYYQNKIIKMLTTAQSLDENKRIDFYKKELKKATFYNGWPLVQAAWKKHPEAVLKCAAQLHEQNEKLIRFLLLLGAQSQDLQYALDLYNLSTVKKKLASFANELTGHLELASAILNPKTTIPFFQEFKVNETIDISNNKIKSVSFPKSIVEKLALEILLTIEPGLADVPSKLLLHLLTQKKPPCTELKKTATLAIREYRDHYPGFFGKEATCDKRRLLTDILQEKFGNHPISQSMRFLVRYSLEKIAKENQYPTKLNIEKRLDYELEGLNHTLKQITDFAANTLLAKYGFHILDKVQHTWRRLIGNIFCCKQHAGKWEDRSLIKDCSQVFSELLIKKYNQNSESKEQKNSHTLSQKEIFSVFQKVLSTQSNEINLTTIASLR